MRQRRWNTSRSPAGGRPRQSRPLRALLAAGLLVLAFPAGLAAAAEPTPAFNTNGRPNQVTASDPRFVDYDGRPWAKNWEQNFEKGWDKPQDELPSAITDIFK